MRSVINVKEQIPVKIQFEATPQIIIANNNKNQEIKKGFQSFGFRGITSVSESELYINSINLTQDKTNDVDLNFTPAVDITIGSETYKAASKLELRGGKLTVIYAEAASQPAAVPVPVPSEDMKKELETLRAENEKLRAALDAQDADATKKALAKTQEELDDTVRTLTTDVQTLEGAITALNSQISSQAQKKQQLETEERTLTDDLNNNYSDAVLDNMRQDNLALEQLRDTAKQNYNAALAEYNKLNGEKGVWTELWEKREAENQKIRESNENIQKQIDVQPQQLKDLQEEHSKLQEKLRQIQNALIECSEEKQQELRGQIDEKQPVADKLQSAYKAVKEKHDELTALITDLTSLKDQEKLALWADLHNAVTSIKDSIETANMDLDALEQDMNTFDSSVEACEEKLKEMKSWYKVDSTPLQKLLEKLDMNRDYNNSELREYLRIQNIPAIRDLIEGTENNLNELDRILSGTIKAGTKDDIMALNRAENGEAVAQREAAKVQ